jgi:CheY-like chemotaxis protein
VVEDDSETRADRALRGLATVISRAEAIEGLALLAQRRFDVLVLELLLPYIDDIRLLRQPHRHIAPAVSRS